MANFSVWDIVKVPFPYTDRPVRQRRPALVVASGSLEKEHGLLWLTMITSAENRGWPEDVAVSEAAGTGLPAPSLVRCAKIATVDGRDAEKIGVLAAPDRLKIARTIADILSELPLRQN